MFTNISFLCLIRHRIKWCWFTRLSMSHHLTSWSPMKLPSILLRLKSIKSVKLKLSRPLLNHEVCIQTGTTTKNAPNFTIFSEKTTKNTIIVFMVSWLTLNTFWLLIKMSLSFLLMVSPGKFLLCFRVKIIKQLIFIYFIIIINRCCKLRMRNLLKMALLVLM